MSKLEELILQYCPDGVEYKKVKDVYKRLKGTPITAGKMKEIATPIGPVRVFAGGKTVIDANEEDIPNANIVNKQLFVSQQNPASPLYISAKSITLAFACYQVVFHST